MADMTPEEKKQREAFLRLLERKGEVHRTAVQQNTRMSAGYVKAHAMRLEREGLITIEELPTGSAIYRRKGVTAPAPGPRDPVTPGIPPPAPKGNGKGVTRGPRARKASVTRRKPTAPVSFGPVLGGRGPIADLHQEFQEILRDAVLGKPDAVNFRLIGLAAVAIALNEAMG